MSEQREGRGLRLLWTAGVVTFLVCTAQQAAAQAPTRNLRFWAVQTAFTISVFDNQFGGSIIIGSPGDSYYVDINSNAKLFGGFFASAHRLTTGAKRTKVGKDRINLLRQLLAAELNCAAFGCDSATQTTIAFGEQAFAMGASSEDSLKSAADDLRAYNRSGTHQTLPSDPGEPTRSTSIALADPAFWDFVP